MEKQIRRLALVMALLFVVLFAAVNYIQVFHASALANNPANVRLLLEEYSVQRGALLARDDRTVLAKSVATGGKYKYLRVYPQGPLYAGITGYYSLIYGRSGLEAAENDFLAARATELSLTNIQDEILGRPKRGADVITTIDPKLQQAADQALGSQQGAVVAIDPRTGEVLAMVTHPTYDPNPLSSHDTSQIRRAYEQLLHDPSKPLLSNATYQLYAPGSGFKMIDTAAALESGLTPQTTLPNPPVLNLPQTTHTLHNFGNELCAGGASRITLIEALTISCNVTFAELGLKLGAQKLYDQSRAFGFDQDVPFELSFHEGNFPPPSTFTDRLPAVAFSAIGQEDVATNPMQMALVAAAIANGGVEMEPHIVKEIRAPNGTVVKTVGSKVWGHPISAQTAADETRMMESVVQSGTGTAAQIPGIQVAGKTGTAETSSGAPNAWFTCFAPAGNPSIAVSVVVLHGGSLSSEATGGQVAAPVAKAVMEAALRSGG